MRLRFCLSRAVVAAFCLAPLSNLYAIAAVTIDESPQGATTEYSILNNSQTTAHPFDITAFAVSTISSNSAPTTTNANWTAMAITPAIWQDVPMDFPTDHLPTWQQYTGMTFVQAFPSAPINVNGYFLDFTYDSGSGDVEYTHLPPIITTVQANFGGFFFQGAPDSTFLALGPPDGTTNAPLGQLLSYSDTAVDVPEPAALSLCLVALGCAAAFFRRARRS
jgi:hypothetical protein